MTEREMKTAIDRLTDLNEKNGFVKESDIHKKIDKNVHTFEEFTEFENKLREMGFVIEKAAVLETVNTDGIPMDEKTAEYISQINKIPMLSVEESKRLAKLASDGDTESKRIAAEAYLCLVAEIAKDYLNYGMNYFDVILEGNLGLVKAIESYDSSKNRSFVSYLTWMIHLYIYRTIVNQGRLLCSLPRVHLVERVEPVKAELCEKLGREPVWEEIEQRLNEILEDEKKTVFDRE